MLFYSEFETSQLLPIYLYFYYRTFVEFLPRRHVVSVCVSVTFVSYVETNKQATSPFSFFRAKPHGNIPTGTPLTGASNAAGVGRNRDSEPISL